MGREEEQGSKKLNMNAAVIDYSRWSQMLAEEFPEVPRSYDDCVRGLLHCEMGTFAQLTDEAITAGNDHQVAKYFAFVDRIRKQADPDVENAIDVSYIEYFAWDEWTERRHQAFERMPPALRRVLLEIDGRSRWACMRRLRPATEGVDRNGDRHARAFYHRPAKRLGRSSVNNVAPFSRSCRRCRCCVGC